VTNSTSTPSLAVAASAIPNSALAHDTISGITLGSNLDNVTFAATGGASAGSTYDGGAALTVSPVTIGAAPALGDATDETTSWSIAAIGIYNFTGSSASTGTLPASITSGFVATVVNAGTAAVTIATGGPGLSCYPVTSCVVKPGSVAFLYEDGTDWYASIPVPVAVGAQSIAVTGSGCSLGTHSGGATAGRFAITASGGTCTATATLPASPGTAWNCSTGVTAGSALFSDVSSTSTSAVLITIEVSSSTSFEYSCVAY
jgi:hypothetical protein